MSADLDECHHGMLVGYCALCNGTPVPPDPRDDIVSHEERRARKAERRHFAGCFEVDPDPDPDLDDEVDA